MPEEKIPFETLIADLHGTDWHKRCDAARLLGRSREPRAVDALLPDLADRDWRVRRNAVQALGALRSSRAVEPLLHALSDRTQTVRQRAAVGLGRIKDPRAIPALVQAVIGNQGSDTSYAAYQALRKFGRRAEAHAVEALREAPNIYLIDLLGEIKAADQIPLLIELAGYDNVLVRLRAAAALGTMKDPRAIRFLIESLKGEDSAIKPAAAQALGKLGAIEAIPAMLDLLEDDAIYGVHSGVYHAIAEAFQEMSEIKAEMEQVFPMKGRPTLMFGPAGIGLPEAVNQMGSTTLVNVNKMLAGMEKRIEEIGGTMNIPAEVVRSLQDSTWRFGAMFEDAREAGQERVKLLIKLLKDPAPLKRAAAALTLPWYVNRPALPALEEALQDEDETAQRAARWARRALEVQLGLSDQSSD